MKVLLTLTEDMVARLDRIVEAQRQTDPGASRSRVVREAISGWLRRTDRADVTRPEKGDGDEI